MATETKPNVTNQTNQEVAFDIEHQALLFALLAKYADELGGAEYLKAIDAAVWQYGLERGDRMRRRALRDGAKMDTADFLCYIEWAPKPGQMYSVDTQLSPEYRWEMHRCEWFETWKRFGLTKYAIHYCDNIDYALVKAFSDQAEMEIYTQLAKGDATCGYRWPNLSFDEEGLKAHQARKQRILPTVIRDFEYHTCHLYASMRKVLLEKLGEKDGDLICRKALEEFSSVYSPAHTAVILARENEDYSLLA